MSKADADEKSKKSAVAGTVPDKDSGTGIKHAQAAEVAAARADGAAGETGAGAAGDKAARPAGAEDKKAAGELFLYDEWLFAKKLGVKPRFVVRWRRERGEEGKHYERVRGYENARAYERIGLTAAGAEAAAKAFGFMPVDPSGCELRREGIQAEVVKVPSNGRLVICERVGAARVEVNGKKTGPLDNVTVRSNGAYRVGDEFVTVREGDALVKQGNGFLPGEW